MITADDFFKQQCLKSNWPKDDLCPPPTDPQYCMNLIYQIIFGEDAYEVMPIKNSQVNTYTMYQMLKDYEWKNKSFLEKVKCGIHNLFKDF